METVNGADPIWGQMAQLTRTSAMDTHVRSDRSGDFVVSLGFDNYIHGWSPDDRAKLSSWIHERNLEGETPTLTPTNVSAARERRSLSLVQKIDRFFRMLIHNGYRTGDLLPWDFTTELPPAVQARNRTMLWIEATSEQEFYGFRETLKSIGALQPQEGPRLTLGRWGIERMDVLQSGANEASRRVFVAMWFDDSMALAYENGIKLAIERAGYEPIRIDRKEHSNKIDDEIILEIRQSRFVVADFTCGNFPSDGSEYFIPRGGVYYEAGFAQGLGIPVIWTVRKDQIGAVHFDTRQYNHIDWTDPADLAERLYNRVGAVIGVRQ